MAISSQSEETETLLDDMFDHKVGGEDQAAITAVNRALELDVPLTTILDGSLIATMEEVGDMVSDGAIFVPEILRPLLTKTSAKPKGLVLLASVQSDVHDIGKKLVGMMLEGAGYKVIDIGANNAAEEILEKARKKKPDVIGLSALLTTTMLNMSKVIKLFKSEDEPYPIIAGGALGATSLVHSLVAKGHKGQQNTVAG